jgi:hypothetical protein
MSTSSAADLKNLFADSGLDPDAVNAMDLTADTLGPIIMAGLGNVSLDDIDASEVLLVKLLIDDSGSIRFISGNADAVRQGHNEMLAALKDSKSAATILVSCQYLNGEVLYPFVPLEQAIEMDSNNYNPNGGTPLYDLMAVTLSGVAAKATEFEQGGVAVRAVTYVITDGADMHSSHHTAASVAKVVEGLLRTESHIVGAMGIDDGMTDFRSVFEDMGIPNEWILTPGNSPSEIRRGFGTISQSAVRASQTAGNFSATALGGFGN